MKVLKIRDSMYRRKIWLIVDFDKDAFLKRFKSIRFEKDFCPEGKTYGFVFRGQTKDETNTWFLAINKHEKKDELFTLDHETVHLAIGILDDLGFEISCQADEAIAYYKEHLFKNAYNLLIKEKIL